MNEPYPGAPDNYSGQPMSEPPMPPAQPSGPPEPYSGPPAATYEPTRQYPAQPYATGQAAPQYGAPSHGASDSYAQPTPGYAQDTAYPQPDAGYGQPGPYGQPPYQSSYGTAPYANTAPAKSGLSTTAIVLIVVAVVVVIGGGVAGAIVATRSSNSTQNASPATTGLPPLPTNSPTTAPPSTAPPSSTAGAGNSIFTLPKTAAGMTLSPNSGLGDIMSKSLPDSVAGETTTGLYTDPNNPSKILILIGTQAKLGNPEVAVIGAFSGIEQSPTIKLKSPKSYNAGSQGGAMECASGSLSELGQSIPVGVCAVADSHGLILTIFTSRSASSAATETRKLRPSFEHS